MTDWSEDNFLEWLAPQLRQMPRRAPDPCPDTAILCEVIEGEALPPQRDAVLAHLSHCPVCAGLQNRLLNFDHGAPPEPEAVWNQTRTRLDNWMEGFLHQEAARSLAAPSRRRAGSFPGWEGIADFFTPRRIVWSISMALALVLIVDGALWLKYRQGPSPHVQVASRPGAPPAGGKLPARPESPQGPGARGPGGVTPPAAPATGNLPTETAQATTPASPHSASSPGGPGNPPTSSQPGPVAPVPQGPLGAPLIPGNPAPPVVAAPLAKLWLNPTGRLLVVVSTIHFKPDGRFEFRATLLLPVPQPGPVPLNRCAEVIGVGAMNQGQTSLTVIELDFKGVRYRLKEGTGDMNAETPGANGGVDFHVSQVLDMWPADNAVYEQVAGPGGPPK